jgi:hypothetical protein
MSNFKISDYLTDYNKITKRGTCISCQSLIKWGKDALASHKRASCTNVSEEEKRIFAKRSHSEAFSSFESMNNDDSMSSNISGCSSIPLSPEQMKDRNSKLAEYFFRTGISLRLVESHAFKEFVKSINPATRWFSRYTSMNDLAASKYVLTRLADEEEDMLKNIASKKTSANVLKLIKSSEFWKELANLVKMIEYPAKVIGKVQVN